MELYALKLKSFVFFISFFSLFSVYSIFCFAFGKVIVFQQTHKTIEMHGESEFCGCGWHRERDGANLVKSLSFSSCRFVALPATPILAAISHSQSPVYSFYFPSTRTSERRRKTWKTTSLFRLQVVTFARFDRIFMDQCMKLDDFAFYILGKINKTETKHNKYSFP